MLLIFPAIATILATTQQSPPDSQPFSQQLNRARNSTHFSKININMHHFPEYRKCSNMIVHSHKKGASIALEGSDDGSVHGNVYHLQKNGALENEDMKLDEFKLDNDIGPDAQFWTDDRVKIQKMVETIPCPRDGDPQLCF